MKNLYLPGLVFWFVDITWKVKGRKTYRQGNVSLTDIISEKMELPKPTMEPFSARDLNHGTRLYDVPDIDLFIRESMMWCKDRTMTREQRKNKSVKINPRVTHLLILLNKHVYIIRSIIYREINSRRPLEQIAMAVLQIGKSTPSQLNDEFGLFRVFDDNICTLLK